MSRYQNIKLKISKLRDALNIFKQDNGASLFDEITRRAFVNNAFDGALTLLGILMGNIIIGEVSPRAIVSTGLGACLAMGVSGSFGRYVSERAERQRTLHQIEQYMFTDLSGSILDRESKKKVLLISFVDGITPALAALIPLIPFFLAQSSIILISTSIVASFALDFIVLFVLGIYLGKISGENMLLHGIVMVGVGFLTSIIILLGSILLYDL